MEDLEASQEVFLAAFLLAFLGVVLVVGLGEDLVETYEVVGSPSCLVEEVGFESLAAQEDQGEAFLGVQVVLDVVPLSGKKKNLLNK